MKIKKFNTLNENVNDLEYDMEIYQDILNGLHNRWFPTDGITVRNISEIGDYKVILFDMLSLGFLECTKSIVGDKLLFRKVQK